MGYFIVFLIVVIVLYFIIVYNKLTKLQNMVHEAFSVMDVCLKKRWDLIPNLVKVVKEYSNYEGDLLERITNIRSVTYDEFTNTDKIRINENINSYLDQVFMLVEDYPILKANENFLNLSKNLVAIEDEIASSRRYYNAVVRMYNNAVQMFPSNLVATLLKFEKEPMFSINEYEKESVKVEL